VVFVVDEAYQGQGIATYMFRMLVRLARERRVQGFTADVLFFEPGNDEGVSQRRLSD
jgi:ribosomal protein S18 acetylase RimI-like enzyme